MENEPQDQVISGAGGIEGNSTIPKMTSSDEDAPLRKAKDGEYPRCASCRVPASHMFHKEHREKCGGFFMVDNHGRRRDIG